MNCTINDLQISFDKEGKLRSTIGRVSEWDINKAYILASFLQDKKFHKYLTRYLSNKDIIKDAKFDFENFTEEDLVKINQNKLGALLNSYYVDTFHSVENSKTNRSLGTLNGFTSGSAKTIAKNHCAELIIDEYFNELTKEPKKRRSSAEIIAAVNSKILDEFYSNYVSPFINDILSNEEYSIEAKMYAQKYIDLLDRIEVLQDDKYTIAFTKALRERKSAVEKSLKELESNIANAHESGNIKLRNELAAKHGNLKKQYKEISNDYNKSLESYKNISKELAILNRDKYVIAQNIVNLYSKNARKDLKTKLINFSNLVAQTRGDINAWYFQVFNNKRMTGIIKAFNNVGNLEEYVEQEEDNYDEIISRYNENSYDDTTKSWEDHFYSNFTQATGARMKFILSKLKNLEQPYNSNSEIQSLDTNNELGVATNMDAQFLTVQIFSYGDFTNVDSMISSLDTKSKTIKDLYGLGELVNRLKEDVELANYVFVNFAKPIVNKTMLVINELSTAEGIDFDYSNPAAFPLTELVFRMSNKLRSTYKTVYNESDKEDINYLRNAAKKELTVEDRNKLFNVLNTYFPNFDKKTFNNFFDNDKSTVVERTQKLILQLQKIVNAVGSLRDKINTEDLAIQERNNKAWQEYSEALKLYDISKRHPENFTREEFEQLVPPTKPTNEYLDFSKYNLTNTMYQGIVGIAKELIEYSPSKARLNTQNANGNTSSDVMKNCFITRFFEQIMAENKNDSQAGLKALFNFITQGTELDGIPGKIPNQYSNNPLFFGLKDATGKVTKPGLFTITDTGYIINPNAKDLIKYNLFDGTKNIKDGIGLVYSEMSKMDFFVSEFLAFDKSVGEVTEGGIVKNIGNQNSAVYSMRIGSDAPKIFFIRAPKYNKTECSYAFYNHVINELNMFCLSLNKIFKVDDKGAYRLIKTTDGLFDRAHYDEKVAAKIRKQGGVDYTDAFVKDGKLVGNMFKFNRLFNVNGYNAGEAIEQLISLYGGENTEPLIINTKQGLQINPNIIDGSNVNSPIAFIDGKFILDLNANHQQQLMNIVNSWMSNYLADSDVKLNDYKRFLEDNNIQYNNDALELFLLNSCNMNMNYDDLFEGDYKFYNGARDFLKRTKESQAGGDGYAGYDITQNHSSVLQDVKHQGKTVSIRVQNGKTLTARNGFRAVTIFNVVRPSDYAPQIAEELKKIFIAKGMSEEKAEQRANKIASGYARNTKTNDAQSYITLDEFIRRRHADGTLYQYRDLIAQLNDPNISPEQINLDEINARIQVQKNFYFDKTFDSNTGLFYPRQIKNAEFVLIPKLLPENSELRKIHDFMVKHDIGQLNTAETSKAAKKNTFVIWNEASGKFNDNFEENFKEDYIETYYYQYLYKQQEVPQHMIDVNNKAAIQIMKKIIDNTSTSSEEIKKLVEEFQNAYSANIKESFEIFLDEMQWEIDSDTGRLVNKEYATTDVNGNRLPDETIELNKTRLNFSQFYSKARQEAARLGRDSNFIEYFIQNEFGSTKMPNYMSNVITSLENIAQSIYNGRITRQILPGWHAAQITNVGYSEKLKFDPTTGVMEVRVPRYSSLIPKGKNAEEDATILKQMEEEGLDINIGYRMPTEGKQSVSVLKIVGFTHDCLGSTIVVPDEWVTQTGSDFDVDSVYGISWEIYTTKDKNGKIKLHKVPFNEEEVNNRQLYIAKIKEKLDQSVPKNDLGEEIDSVKKQLRDKYNNKNFLKEQSAIYDKLDNERNELFEKLDKRSKAIIAEINKNTRKVDSDGQVYTDIKEGYPLIINKLKERLDNNKNLKEEDKNIIANYIEHCQALLDIMSIQEETPIFDNDSYLVEIRDEINSIIENAKLEQIRLYEKAAKEIGFVNFEDFCALPIEERLTRRGRNNYILDRMIKIMNDTNSREEQYSRSQFEDIVNDNGTGANNVVDKLLNEDAKARSPYNPLDQLDYFEDAMQGARLKALSVNWDNFASKCNRLQAELSSEHSVEVIIELDENTNKESIVKYDEQEIRKSYKNDVSNYITIPISNNSDEKIYTLCVLGGEKFTISKSRIEQLIGIINNLKNDDTLITIPYKEFIKYDDDLLTDGGIRISLKEEIKDFILNTLDKEYSDMPFKKNEFYITKSIYELLKNATSEEFVGILNGYYTIVRDKNIKVLERTIDNSVIEKSIDMYSDENALITAFYKTFDDDEYYSQKILYTKDKRGFFNIPTTFNIIISKEVIDNEKFKKQFPNFYNLFLQKYNNQNGISNDNIKNNNSNNANNDRTNNIIFRANKIGWSYDNHNIIGAICTTYTAETTSHHLDAIKEGSIPNVDEFTFNVYKMLSILGLDYEHIIGFVRQPIISRLVENNRLINSVFANDNNYPIRMTLANLTTDLKFKHNKKDVTIYTPQNNLIELFKSNQKFVSAFNELFGINISEMDNRDILNIKVPLRKSWLFNRLRQAANGNNSIDINHPDAYKRAAFDFAMLLNFRNYNATASKLNSYIRISSPDKAGAKPELRSNRELIKEVEELRNDDTIFVGLDRFVDAIFPKKENSNEIDVEKSLYRPLAAFYSYTTLSSNESNSQLFITENEDFVDAYNAVQSYLPRHLTDAQYKKLKKYAIASMYAKCPILLTPISLNERGNIVIDEKNIEDYSNYWDIERTRIIGYGITSTGDFTIENVNNPTVDEIAKFSKLTPAQKVMFIQKHFADNQGLFENIKVTIYNNKDSYKKGYTRQYLSFDDQVDNIEDMFNMFIMAFANHNPLIKLTAIDLVKYAFVSENFNFKSGYITKIIPNSVLYTTLENGGMDIINTFNTLIKELPNEIRSEEFIMNFIRSHSDLIPIRRFPKLAKRITREDGESIISRPNISSKLLQCCRADGLIHLDLTGNDPLLQEVAKYIGLEGIQDRFIKLSFPLRDDTYRTTLFKIVGKNNIYNSYGNHIGFEDYFLVPLNLLESNEAYDYSYNQSNNRFNSYDYYLTTIEKIAQNYASYRELSEKERSKKKPKQVISQYNPVSNNIIANTLNDAFTSNEFTLMQLAESSDSFLSGISNKIINDYLKHFAANKADTKIDNYYFINQSNQLEIGIPEGKTVYQTIVDSEGNVHNISITRIKRSKKSIQTLEKVNKKNDESHELYDVVRQMNNAKILPNRANIYMIKEILPTKEERKENVKRAITDIIDPNEPANPITRRVKNKADDLSSSIINQISYDAKRNKDKSAVQFIKELERNGVNKHRRVSLTDHRENIYKSAERYYRSKANDILTQLDAFTIEGVEYALDDPAIFDALYENPEYFGEIANLILDGITFGNRISDIFLLDALAEDFETKNAIEGIRRHITSVKQNRRLSVAMENMINVYFRKYSTNPLIVDGLLKLRDSFGDIDVIMSMISDPTDINNNEVQVILKEVYTMFSQAEMFEVNRNLKEFNDERAAIQAMSETMDMDKIVDFDSFSLRQGYNDQYIKDKESIQEEYTNAQLEYQTDPSKVEQYVRAKYKRDKFLADYTEQPVVGEYYDQDIALRKEVMDKAGSRYFEYVRLSHELYDTSITRGMSEEELSNYKRRIVSKMNRLSEEEIDPYLSPESEREFYKARALKRYLEKRKALIDKYFETTEYSGFSETYKRYNGYVKAYNQRHKYQSLEDKFKDDDYREAYQWLKSNGKIKFSKEASDKVKNAFKLLTNRKSLISTNTRMGIKDIPGAVDSDGIIDGRKLSEEQILQIRDEEYLGYTRYYDSGSGDSMLIKSVYVDVLPMIYESSKRKTTNISEEKYKDNAAKFAYIDRINQILSKAVDRYTGRLDFEAIFNNSIISEEERKELINLYEKLRNLRSEKYKRFRAANTKGNEMFKEVIDPSYNDAMGFYRTKLLGTKQAKEFLDLFTVIDENGDIQANPYIFGYKIPTEEFIDKEKTAARKFINDNVDFVTTEYYELANREAAEQDNIEQGYYERWFRANHVYNPFTHKYEPIKIWTTIEAKPGSELAESVEYIPTFDNTERNIREEFVNNEENRTRLGLKGKGYREFSTNYKRGNSKYDSQIILNRKEEAMRDLLERTLRKHATTYKSKRFIAQGYLPREMKTDVNPRWVAGQIASLFGLSWHSGSDSDSFRDNIGYEYDKEAEFNMLKLIQTKDSQKYESIPEKGNMSDAEYNKLLKEIRERNRKIKEKNLEIDKAKVSKDIWTVMENFINNATIFNSRQRSKPFLYLLIEDLATNNAYTVKGFWNDHLIKDYERSTQDDPKYRMERQTRTRDLIINQARRLIYGQYHEVSKRRSVANLLQNMTSAKYMIFNFYGGIANVATGLTNIGMERYANEYFGFKEFANAEKDYISCIHHTIASLNKDTSDNLTVALMKLFDVVNFDDMLQFGEGSKDLNAKLKKVRDFTYSFQSMGEHYMQNSVLLAMLKSNRLYKDSNGIYRVGDFKDFSWDVEKQAMRDIIKDNEELSINYEIYIKSIEKNIEDQLDLDTGRTDINRNFLYTLRDNINPATRELYEKTAKLYHARRNELMEESNKKFINKGTVLQDIFELKDGRAVIKQEYKSLIINQYVDKVKSKPDHTQKDIDKATARANDYIEKLISSFREKTKKVNHKIHGVYNKDGAAQIEKKWFGSLLMQYHKHLPWGIWKRWRRRGYYSEFRNSKERGSYQTLLDFMFTEFTNFGKRIDAKVAKSRGINDRSNIEEELKNNKATSTEIALASIQTVFESIINTFTHIGFNWHNLSNWERANIRRNLADMTGAVIAMLVAGALYGLSDDDDLEDDTFTASLLYLADRLYIDSTMYTPTGLVSEYRTLWSSPIASANGPSDLLKAMTMIPQYLFDPDFEKTHRSGQWAGKDKLTILFRRNLPGIRPYDRIINITINNQYYKIGESHIGINIAKNFGELFNE